MMTRTIFTIPFYIDFEFLNWCSKSCIYSIFSSRLSTHLLIECFKRNIFIYLHFVLSPKI